MPCPPAPSIRRTLFCDRAVQGVLLLHVVGHWLMFVIVAGLFLLFIEMLSGDPREAWPHMPQRNGPSMLAVFVLAPIFLRDLFKLTNRFAGPMVRLRRAMRDLAQGDDVAPIHFRDGDFWKDLATDFNRVVQRMQNSRTPPVSENPGLSQPDGRAGADRHCLDDSLDREPTELVHSKGV